MDTAEITYLGIIIELLVRDVSGTLYFCLSCRLNKK